MKRLKSQYHQSVKKPHPNDYFYKRFPNVKSVYHKKFSTHQEKSFYSIHCIESLYTTNFTEPLSYQDSAFLKLPKSP